MKLDRLEIRHFKGVDAFEVDAGGEDLDILGANGAGKSSLRDAFLWLLTEKNSENKDRFGILPRTEGGELVEGLVAEAVASLITTDGQRVSIKKAHRQKMTRARGAAEAAPSGYTTDHWIHGAPAKQKDYRAGISSLIGDESVFRLLCDLRYFNEFLPWDKRRELLLAVVGGDVDDAEVYGSRDDLAELPDLLADRTMEQHRAYLAERRKDLNKAKEGIQPRIDEAHGLMPEQPAEAVEKLQERTAELRRRRDELSEAKAGLQPAEQIRQLRDQLDRIDARRREIAREQVQALEDEDARLSSEIRKYEDHISGLRREVEDAAALRQRQLELLAKLDDELEGLRKRWREIDQTQVEPPEVPDTCWNCKRPLDPEDVAANRQQAQAKANQEKAEALEQISRQGHELRERREQVAAEEIPDHEMIRRQIQIEENSLQRTMAKRDEVRSQIAARRGADTAELEDLRGEEEQLRAEIEQAQQGGEQQREKLAAQLHEIDQQLNDVGRLIYAHERRDELAKRVEQLQGEEVRLQRLLDGVKRQEWLCDEFVKAKVQLLDQRINSRFELARFKLYEVQVNGAVNDRICETTLHGVPYSDLSNGERILVGLDIIRTLQQHYQVELPVWIDNAESFHLPIEMPCQLIRLIVDPKAKVLKAHKRTREVAA